MKIVNAMKIAETIMSRFPPWSRNVYVGHLRSMIEAAIEDGYAWFAVCHDARPINGIYMVRCVGVTALLCVSDSQHRIMLMGGTERIERWMMPSSPCDILAAAMEGERLPLIVLDVIPSSEGDGWRVTLRSEDDTEASDRVLWHAV